MSGRPLCDEARARALAFVEVADRAMGAALKRGCPSWLREDMRSAALEALCRAARDWNADLSPDFAAYAARRCRGAVIDELRAYDWMPREGRRRHNDYWRSYNALFEASGQAPSPDAVAEDLNVPLAARRQLFRDAGITYVSIESLLVEVIDRAQSVEDIAVWAALARQVHALVKGLSKRKQIVYRRRFEDGANMATIAAELGVTESRVSQVCTEIMLQLRAATGALEAA